MNSPQQKPGRQTAITGAQHGSDTRGFIETQPLVAGAIGLAIGAALGAAIPATEVEDRLMGEPASELKRRAGELVKEEYANVKETVGQLYEEVREEAATLSAAPSEMAGQVAERLVAAATGAGIAAKDNADELGRVHTEKKSIEGGLPKAPAQARGKAGSAEADGR